MFDWVLNTSLYPENYVNVHMNVVPLLDFLSVSKESYIWNFTESHRKGSTTNAFSKVDA